VPGACSTIGGRPTGAGLNQVGCLLLGGLAAALRLIARGRRRKPPAARAAR
jgi:hypothetical protein